VVDRTPRPPQTTGWRPVSELDQFAALLRDFGDLALRREAPHAQAKLAGEGIMLRRPAGTYDDAGNPLASPRHNLTGLPRHLAYAVRVVEEWHDRLAQCDAQRAAAPEGAWNRKLGPVLMATFTAKSVTDADRATPGDTTDAAAYEPVQRPTAGHPPSGYETSEQALDSVKGGIKNYLRQRPSNKRRVGVAQAADGLGVDRRTLWRNLKPFGLMPTIAFRRVWAQALAEYVAEARPALEVRRVG
jgi:hypothetical protein